MPLMTTVQSGMNVRMTLWRSYGVADVKRDGFKSEVRDESEMMTEGEAGAGRGVGRRDDHERATTVTVQVLSSHHISTSTATDWVGAMVPLLGAGESEVSLMKEKEQGELIVTIIATTSSIPTTCAPTHSSSAIRAAGVDDPFRPPDRGQRLRRRLRWWPIPRPQHRRLGIGAGGGSTAPHHTPLPLLPVTRPHGVGRFVGL